MAIFVEPAVANACAILAPIPVPYDKISVDVSIDL
jgi:hypothetical protein